VALNLVAAFVIFTVLAWIGMPQILDNQYQVKSDTKVVHQELLVAYVQPGSPAAKAGLQERDKLLTVAGKPVKSAEKLPEVTKQYAGKTVPVTYDRDGVQGTTNVTLRTDKEAKGTAYLGLSPSEYTLTRATWSAPVQSLGLMWQFTEATFKGIGVAISALFQGDTARASEQVSGPVGIFWVLKQGSVIGYQFVLLIIGAISLSLAIMNVLPIPALDGGRFYVLLLSRAFGKKLSQEMEERIVSSSFVFLLLLIALITIVDVKRFF
jgi:regulator of sigma E protease